LLAGCAATPAADDGVLRVVASTSVYGDIASAVAGDLAEVESIVTSTAQDPHSYEVTARDRLELESADLIVYNGGGYDAFVESVLDAKSTPARTVEAVEVAGLADHDDADHDHGEHEGHGHLEGLDEHVWYDLHAMAAVAHAIATELGELDPAHADEFEANAATFAESLEAVETDLGDLRDRVSGLGVVMTEPVPAYLLAEAGLEDVTPEGFAEAIEEGSDVPPALLAAVLAVIADGRAALVTDNPQTTGPETIRVLDAAKTAGVPVVSFLELLPEGSGYAEWMAANVAALAAALP